MYGYSGKILKIDLTSKKIEYDNHDEKFYRKYVGGAGIGLYYMLKETKPNCHPLSKENLLIFAPGIITGCPAPASPRYTVITKSPLTGTIGKSEAGGFWGPELKKAGLDSIVIKGKADKPVYIYIEDDKIEIIDAKDIWGLTTKDCQLKLREKHGKVRVAQIGPGGENLVKYANICNELAHFNGRNGTGCVMGSKNLKAIVVKASGKVKCYDEEKVKEITKWVAKEMKNSPQAWGLHKVGTPAGISAFNVKGVLPTNNFGKSYFEDADDINSDSLQEISESPKGCYSCPIRCKRVVKIDEENMKVDPDFGGPEYETLSAIGSNMGIRNLKIISKANEMCNKYTIDTISTGLTISFAMECYEKGLLSKEDTDGLELRFGNEEIVLELIDKITYKEGFGALLAEGSLEMAKRIGKGALELAMQVKGQELALHDPREKAGMALQYALASNGADHWTAPQDTLFKEEGSKLLKSIGPLGILDAIDPIDLSYKKVRLFYYTHLLTMAYENLGLCNFLPEPRSILPINDVVELTKAVSGWNTSLWELMKAAERTSIMMRYYNGREGFGKKDDDAPKRLFEAFSNGAMKGQKPLEYKDFEEAIDLYYQMAGLDADGLPSKMKLYELDLDWLVH